MSDKLDTYAWGYSYGQRVRDGVEAPPTWRNGDGSPIDPDSPKPFPTGYRDGFASSGPHIVSITRRNGVAGQYVLAAVVEYPGEGRSTVAFYGSTYGGPIVMETGVGSQVFVSAAVLDRIGHTLTESWVRAFFGGAR
jgi:hypothetical protein